MCSTRKISVDEICAAFGINYSELAQIIGVSVSSVYRWKDDLEKVSPQTLRLLFAMQSAIKVSGFDRKSVGDLVRYGEPAKALAKIMGAAYAV